MSLFYQTSGLGYDTTDESQRQVANTRYSQYTTTPLLPTRVSDGYMNTALTQPDVHVTGLARGTGLAGDKVNFESFLVHKAQQERPDGKVQLFQRPFATVPYLGRGSADMKLERSIQTGYCDFDMKSERTVMDKSFLNYSMYPSVVDGDEYKKNNGQIEETVLGGGWVRGGAQTRE